jgi:hypothetical protein
MPTRRLYLPDGGSFDLQMPSGRIVAPMRGVVASESCPSVLVPVLAGAVLGGLSTWLLLKLIR